MTYYITSSEYVGPNRDQHLNDNIYTISTTPGRTNMSHEIRTDGWLGTTNDWAYYAHGEFETEADARAEIEKLLPDGYRKLDCDEPTGIDDDGNLTYDLARYSVGKFEDWDAENSVTWCYEIRHEITAETTDERIDELVDECEGYANAEGVSLDGTAIAKMLTERRDELLAESAE
jgi:hypothetical protein